MSVSASNFLATIKRDVPLLKNELSDYELHFNAEGAREALKELEMGSLLDDIPAAAKDKVVVITRTIADLLECTDFFAVIQHVY